MIAKLGLRFLEDQICPEIYEIWKVDSAWKELSNGVSHTKNGVIHKKL